MCVECVLRWEEEKVPFGCSFFPARLSLVQPAWVQRRSLCGGATEG